MKALAKTALSSCLSALSEFLIRRYQQPFFSSWTGIGKGGTKVKQIDRLIEIAHRRWGKDEIALRATLIKSRQRPASYWHLLPEYAQGRKALWSAVNPHTGKRRIDEAFPPETIESRDEQAMFIRFKWGSTWQIVGSDRFDSLVGAGVAGVVFSEWALANPNARAYLRPIIAENNGWQLFITTSRGRNHAYTTFKAAQKDKTAFAQILDATQTNVFTKEQLEREKQSYIDDFGYEYGLAKFEQEFLCSFDAANLGAILARSISNAEREGRVSDEWEFDPDGAPIEISSDIGHRDSSTWWFWQPQVGGYQIVDYDGGWGMDADAWCDRLEEKLSKYRRSDGSPALGKIWLPHDARAKTFAAKHSAVEIFIKRFGHDKIDITPNSKKADRVNAARVTIGKCAFHETNCSKGLDGLRSWSYEYNEETKIFSSEPKHDWASHDGDGFSYGCIIMSMYKPVLTLDEKLRAISIDDDSVINVSLNELWSTIGSKSTGRI